MKRFLMIIMVFSVLSCDNWLDVEPVKEAAEDEMYGNTKGFYAVLNGLYLEMGMPALYGQHLTWGAMDAWARVYTLDQTVEAHRGYLALWNADYEVDLVKGYAEGFWEYGYKLIARANNLIQNIESREGSFFLHGETEKGVLLGEALAVRALLHLDMARIFAQAPALDPDGRYVPWVGEYPSLVNPVVPTREVLSNVITDLQKSKQLLALYDTLPANQQWVFSTINRFNEKSVPPAGTFYACRGSHLNYLAVTGVLARALMWAGRETEALAEATEIIGYVTANRLAFAKSTTIAQEPKMREDVLFALYRKNLAKDHANYEDYSSSSALCVEDGALFREITSDKRAGILGTRNVLLKYAEDKNSGFEDYIPMIRLSELYYIAGECYAKQQNMPKAIELLNTLRKARGITKKLATTLEKEQYMAELIKDARKDWCGEGQLLYLYKRLNEPVCYSEGQFNHGGHLLLPRPESESAM